MAKFIVIDGLDGCGKATQTELLKDALERKGKKVIKLSFPNYESDSSAAVKMYLNGKLGDNPSNLNPYMCGTFYAVDRFIQYITDWKKYLDEDDNTFIISDRYLSANIIHQGGKIESREDRLKYAKWCYEYECGLCGLPKEDLTILLTINPKTSQLLLNNRYNGDESKKDIHELDLEYLCKCYERLLETYEDIQNLANWKHLSCDSDSENGVKSIEEIHLEVMKLVSQLV